MSHDTASALEMERRLEAEEHVGAVLRLRRAAGMVIFAWPAFALLDWVVVTFIAPGPIAPFLWVRLAGLLALGGCFWALRPPQIPSPAVFRALDVTICVVASVALAAMTRWYHGITSPYGAGVALVLACRGAYMAQPWRRGLLPIFAPIAGYVAVALGSAALSPAHRAQLTEPASLALFFQYQSFVLGVAVFALVGGHVTWSLRRQVFESRSIGRYRLRRRLGQGGMGEVWAAFHTGLGRDVALKILRPERQDPVAIERFKREVRAMTDLTHPNTVRVFDYGVTDDGLWYYAMELLEGEDLASLARREGPLSPERAVHFVLQAARALAEAHARGIVHRDVKPENLFVTHAGIDQDLIRVLDFGIAKSETAPGDTLTGKGQITGTPSYMSPEAASGRPVTPASDVYGLGAVLYLLLAGAPPFERPNVAALLFAHIQSPPTPPSHVRGSPLPADLEAIVLRTLSKRPEDRHADAARLADALLSSSIGSWHSPEVTAVRRAGGSAGAKASGRPSDTTRPDVDPDAVTVVTGGTRA